MAKLSDRIARSQFVIEAIWLREFALFYGVGGRTRFSEEDLNDVSLVEIYHGFANPSSIWCEKCDEPGTVCVIEAFVGDEEAIRIKVHFDSQQMTITILKAERVEEPNRDQDNAA